MKNANTSRERQDARKQIDREIGNLRRIGDEASGDAQVQLQIAQAFAEVKEPALAIQYADRTLAIDPKQAQAYAVRGDAEYQLRRYPEAVVDADKALAIEPGNKSAVAIKKLVESHAGTVKMPAKPEAPSKGGTDVQVPVFKSISTEMAAKSKRRFSDNLVGKSLGQMALDPAAAMSLADQAVAADPDNPQSYAQRAQLRLGAKDLAGVIEDVTRAIALGVRQALLYDLRAMARIHRKEFKEAKEDADSALSLDPHDARAFMNKAMALEGLGAPTAEIREAARKAIELDPALRASLAATLKRMGDSFTAESAPRPSAAPAASSTPPLLTPGLQLAAGVCLLLVAFIVWRLAFGRSDGDTPAPLEAPPAQALKEGDVLAGTLRVVGLIGQGGMGAVYEAFDTALQRPVAVKRLIDSGSAEVSDVNRLIAEGQAVAALRHPNIVAIHQIFEQDGAVYLVFERVQGKTLAERLAAGPLPPSECAALLKPLCAALDFAHDKRILHRDLKPSNLMLEGGALKILDFGIARRVADGRSTRTGLMWGSPAYMAPELEHGEVSRESDLYAVGVTLYELLTTRLPFEAPPSDKRAGRFPPPSVLVHELSPQIDEFFLKALAPTPALRFRSGADLCAAFEKAVQVRA